MLGGSSVKHVAMGAVVLMAVSTACGKKKDSTVANATADALIGSWSTGCVADGSSSLALDKQFGLSASYQISTQSYTADAMTISMKQYSDSACATQVGMQIAATATYSVGADIAAITGAKEFDYTPTKVTLTLMDDATVSGINSGGGLCGKTDWATGTGVDVTTCSFKSGDPALNTEKFDLIKVDTTVTPNTYVNGKQDTDHDETTAAKRPAALDTTVYKKG